MPSPLEGTILRQVNRYLAGKVSLQEFDAWFVNATVEVDRTGPPAAVNLTYEIFGRLAEYSNGDWTEAELKEFLRRIAALAPITAAP